MERANENLTLHFFMTTFSIMEGMVAFALLACFQADQNYNKRRRPSVLLLTV
jgi:hypothetical protein